MEDVTKKLEFTPFNKDSDPFTVTFDDDDRPVAIDGNEGLQGVLDSPELHPLAWWEKGFDTSYDIVDKSDEVETSEDDEASKFRVAKLDVDKRLVFGWAYVTHDEQGNVMVDKSGEFIDDTDELETAAYEFVVKSRMAGDMHQRDLTAGDTPVQVGTMVESMVFTPEKVAKLGLPPGSIRSGWWVGFRIENDTVWNAVKNGERPAFSIHGNAKKEDV